MTTEDEVVWLKYCPADGRSLGWPGLSLTTPVFFLAFAVYTIKAAREMNDVVFSSSCLQPWRLVVRGVLTSHTCSLVTL